MSNNEHIDYKECPYCCEKIKAKAIKCKHCKSLLSEHEELNDNNDSNIDNKNLDYKKGTNEELGEETRKDKNNFLNETENEVIHEFRLIGLIESAQIKFTGSYIEHKNIKINYEDIDSITCSASNLSVNFIPTNQSYIYKVASKDKLINFNKATVLKIGNKKLMEEWVQLLSLSVALFEPIIIPKLLSRVFDDKETLDFGGFYINSEGYYTKFILRGKEFVSWDEKIYEPTYFQGIVQVYDGNGNEFCHIGLGSENAVLIPTLFKECYESVASYMYCGIKSAQASVIIHLNFYCA